MRLVSRGSTSVLADLTDAAGERVRVSVRYIAEVMCVCVCVSRVVLIAHSSIAQTDS